MREASREEGCASAGWVPFGDRPAASRAVFTSERAESRAGTSPWWAASREPGHAELTSCGFHSPRTAELCLQALLARLKMV